MEEIKSNPKNIIFATLTFSEESLKKLEYNEKEPNKAPQKAISLFRKRWWKKYKTPLKHWLITELGHDNTKRIHLHGIVWTELTEEQFEKEWGYGWIFFGYEVNERTINHIIKYITKRDEPHNQMTLYTIAGQVVLNAPVKGVIVRAAQILLDKENRFVSGFTLRTPDQLEEWMNDLRLHLERAEEYATRGYWPMNDTACDKFGGCKFRGVCSKSPSVREIYLKSDFEQLPREEIWSPLRSR